VQREKHVKGRLKRLNPEERVRVRPHGVDVLAVVHAYRRTARPVLGKSPGRARA
jgi:hypothetical protein